MSERIYRVLVTGSRDWSEPERVWSELDAAFDRGFALGADRMVVVHGACPTGADRQASEWTQAQNDTPLDGLVSEEAHPADWSQGRKAGPERNLRMVQLGAHECLAFVGPCTSPRCGRVDRNHDSHGASGCSTLAAATGIKTTTIRPIPAPRDAHEPAAGSAAGGEA